MEVITVASLVALIKKAVDLLKYVTNKQYNALVTQVVVWVAAVAVVFLAANANLTSALQVFGNTTLGSLDGGSLILGGLLIGSSASVFLHDVPAAIDNKDTAYAPPLLPDVATRKSIRA